MFGLCNIPCQRRVCCYERKEKKLPGIKFVLSGKNLHVVPLIEQLEIKTYMPGLGLGLEQRYAAFLGCNLDSQAILTENWCTCSSRNEPYKVREVLSKVTCVKIKWSSQC